MLTTLRPYLLLALSLLLSGCSIIMSGKDVEQHIEMMRERNPSGCAYLKGSGTPPASRVDGGVVSAWGKDMTVKDCKEILTNLP